MIKLLITILHNCFTGSDNKTFDPARIAGYIFALLMAATFFILFSYVTIATNTFDAEKFLIGSGAVSVAISSAALGVRIKNNSEPKENAQ
jgi:hypothetical protein